MMVLYSPCVSDNNEVRYEFYGEKVIAIINGEVDEFDFTGTPDGVMEDVSTTLPLNPIRGAERVNGELKITLLNFIKTDSADDTKFPEWVVM